MKKKNHQRLPKLYWFIRTKYRTHYELASQLKIPDYRLSLYLNGRRNFSEKIVSKLEKILRVSRDQFLPSGYILSKRGRK